MAPTSPSPFFCLMSDGKSVGISWLICWTSCSSPARVTEILLAEYEKVREFTIEDPMFWLSWATSDLPG